MPDEHFPIEHTQTQSPADEARSKDLSLQRTRPPTEIPEYQVQQFLGAGAYGEVWAGLDRNTGRKVAIKYYAHRRGVDWSLLSREVEKLVFLSADRYVVQLLEVGWDADPPYYVMEFIENGSLEDKLQRQGTFSPADATEMFREIGIGLVHAHGRGVLHCDLKPANVLIDQDGRPRLADFGQSRLSHEQKPALGTLFYMAPEQADMQAVPDARWDVYALGAIFYCLLIGRPPHRHDHSVSHIETATDLEDRLARYRQIIQEAPVPQEHRRIRGVDARLAEVIERCLAPNPDNRFANVQEVLDALVNRERALARQKMMAVGLLGPLLVLVVAGIFNWRGYQEAVGDTEVGYRTYARENNQFAARLAAEKVTSEIGKYFIIVRSEALEPEMRGKLEPLLGPPGMTELSKLMQKMQDPRTGSDERTNARAEFLAHPQRQELNQYLEDRLNIYLRALKHDKLAPRFASVFVVDRWGNQLAVAFEDPTIAPTTIGLNVAHRSYFHGGLADAGESPHPPEAGEVSHIRQTQLSAIFKSSSQKTWKVAFSTPIYRGEGNGEFLGILVYTINVGDFVFFREENKIVANQFAVLVDGRPATTRGSILQHPLLTSIAEKGEKPPEELLSMRVPEEFLERDMDKLYTDPLGKHALGKDFAKNYIAAVASVRAPSVPGVAYDPKTEDTGLDVLVQSEYDKVIAPVRELGKRLLRNIVLMLAVVVIAGIAVWTLALRVFRDPKRPSKASPSGNEPSPLHRMSTLEALR
ncbi:MAG: serine/threonine protein kinase [Planctomycetales bacterium]|nr:serine/threonine protein kinase [Planctomycetales bacterium]